MFSRFLCIIYLPLGSPVTSGYPVFIWVIWLPPGYQVSSGFLGIFWVFPWDPPVSPGYPCFPLGYQVPFSLSTSLRISSVLCVHPIYSRFPGFLWGVQFSPDSLVRIFDFCWVLWFHLGLLILSRLSSSLLVFRVPLESPVFYGFIQFPPASQVSSGFCSFLWIF